MTTLTFLKAVGQLESEARLLSSSTMTVIVLYRFRLGQTKKTKTAMLTTRHQNMMLILMSIGKSNF